MIFSWSQIGRFGISQREIGVSDREILRGIIISYFHQKLAFFDTLKDKFLGGFFGCHSPTMQLSIVSKEIIRGCLT